MDTREALAVLGAEPGISIAAAQALYKRRAMLLHPDRYEGSSTAIRAEAARAMTQLNEALATLRRGGTTYSGRSGQEGADSRAGAPPPPPGAAQGTSPPVQRRLPNSTECQNCGHHPAGYFSAQWQTGWVFAWNRTTARGTYCRDCAGWIYNEAQARTLLQGWWGFLAFIRNWYVLARNVFAWSVFRAISRPVGREAGIKCALDLPLPLSRSAFVRPAGLAASGVAICLVVALVVNL